MTYQCYDILWNMDSDQWFGKQIYQKQKIEFNIRNRNQKRYFPGTRQNTIGDRCDYEYCRSHLLSGGENLLVGRT